MADPRIVVTTQGARFLGRKFPCSIGRGGVRSEKREGDGATPAGEFALGGILYRPDRIPRNLLPRLARPIGLNWIWSDDPGDPAYNSLVANGFDYPFGHEFMRRADRQYDLVVPVGYNECRIPGGGSAIFLHVWRKPRHPTAGCVAFALRDLIWIAGKVRPDTRIAISTK
ncbi:MAG: L,D-transpeptidase family protein [Albidovulum sp.]|nr:L,D-transpeptidase family protein [Albidovulum sp.]MDE0533259.1 L,D-transpeptidase family protein [Albidovulum sp.]